MVIDWHSRKVMAWRLSNSMETDFSNIDQGSQFTSLDFVQALQNAGVRVSKDGKGRWMDSVMIERPWCSLKYECVLACLQGRQRSRKGIGD